MRCPANTHKPSFHVNTSLMTKHNSGKGTSSGQRGARVPPNMEETMTEEEFFEWLQNAAESPSSKPGNGTKNQGNGSAGASGSSSKRKKKGKKQW
ncbi:hypothetical protein Ahy_B04g070060 isoform H [Arachis hypogaea]|uniref:Uncharacterized protein n=1 Tax=Arachis hypogaea TaxID=3818 RepID=A0A444ZEK9_ARAHY|nr:hypothetical protein Ahy_B04g070060 isoform H [Arachis hypogaea]